jgi:hypothetical protein
MKTLSLFTVKQIILGKAKKSVFAIVIKQFFY